MTDHKRISIGSSSGIVIHEGDGKGEPICNEMAGRQPLSLRRVEWNYRPVSPNAEVTCSTCLRLAAVSRYDKLVAELRFVCSSAGDINVSDVLPGYLNRLDPSILEGLNLGHQKRARKLVYESEVNNIEMLEAKLRARGCEKCGDKVGIGLLDVCETHRLEQTLAVLKDLES